MTRFNNLLKCEDPADGLSLNALLTSSSAGITKKEKTMKWALALALGLIVCLPCMAATAASTSCDSVSTPNRQVNEETVRRIEQNWITAECLLEPDYRTSGRSGQVRTRQDVIDHVSLTTDMSKPIPALQTIVFILGNRATAHSIMRTTDKDGNPGEVHFVDGHTFHNGRWFAYSGADF